jgi:predicted Zn-dependent protease
MSSAIPWPRALPDAECVMHFSNALVDTDRKGHRPCAVCERKPTARRHIGSP